MKNGDKVRITNIDNMWDKEIYYQDYGLDQDIPLDNPPHFDCSQKFENEDVVKLFAISDNTYMLIITLIDNDGKSFDCESQHFSISELETFCEVVN